jgi:formylglycine-generating enzyme required for sulfatase activity
MPRKVFISYRRDDSAGHAGRVHDRLEREFGPDLLFMDVDAIPLGVNFIKVLREEVARCDVLLAVIGPNWLNVRDEEGNRRLDNPSDFLRIEIATALQRDIPVIPILLDGARMPKADQLPKDLEELAVRNGLDIRHASFHSDMDRLIRGLKGPQASHQTTTRPFGGTPPAPSQDDRMRAEGRVLVDAAIVNNANGKWFLSGAGHAEWFKDHEAAPEMVMMPAGKFMMGPTPSEIAALTKEFRNDVDWKAEGPQHEVTIAQPFAVGRYAVTFAEWDACVADGGCNGYQPRDEGWGRGKLPVINVNWDDAKAYAAWLSRKTGKTYRLLSEAEREYATRAGTTTAFWWGPSISTSQANYDGNYTFAGGARGEYRQKTIPVDSFAPNPWGLYNVHGNVWEWVEDCWHDSYQGAPSDGSPWTTACTDASRRVVRGGSWISDPRGLRAADRRRDTTVYRGSFLGFRLARTLNP